MEFEDLSFL